MSYIDTLYLELPGLLSAMHAEDYQHPITILDLPTLSVVLSKADQIPRNYSSYYSLADHEISGNCDAKWGTEYLDLRSTHDEHQEKNGFWLRADPMIHQAQTLAVHLLGNRQLPRTLNMTSFQQKFNQIFAETIQLSYLEPYEGYLFCSNHPQVEFISPLQALGKDQLHCFPKGNDANYWKKIITEIQMWLHSIQAMDRNQESPFNSLFLWGNPNACLPNIQAQYLVSSSHLLLGAAKRLQISHEKLPDCYQLMQLESFKDQNIQCLQIVDLELLWLRRQGLVTAWQNYLQTWQKSWLAPMLEALKAGQVKQLALDLGNDYIYELRAKHLRRFWRKNKPLEKFCH